MSKIETQITFNFPLTITFPFHIEGDAQGHSFIDVDEDLKYHYKNNLQGRLIKDEIIEEKEVRKIIRECYQITRNMDY